MSVSPPFTDSKRNGVLFSFLVATLVAMFVVVHFLHSVSAFVVLVLILLLVYMVAFALFYPQSFLTFNDTALKCNGITSTALFLVAVLVLSLSILLIRSVPYFSGILFLELVVSATVVALTFPLFRCFVHDPSITAFLAPAIFLLVMAIHVKSPLSFVSHMNKSHLRDFRNVVEFPNVYVPTELDSKLSLPEYSHPGLFVLLGPPGVGKSVALFEHLKNEKVLWLSGRHGFVGSARVLGFEGSSAEELYNDVLSLVATKRFTLVIDDAQSLSKDDLMASLYQRYGSIQPPFRIFLTISDEHLYYRNIYSYITRTASEIRASYPSPSLRELNMYKTTKSKLFGKCVSNFNIIGSLDDLLPVMKEFTTNFVSDYARLNLNEHNISSVDYNNLVSRNLLAGSYSSAHFHTPLVRRAACTYFEKEHSSACNVTLCHLPFANKID
ncbi:hypothetical protein RCL1_000701 [Eukaryota sp. TZLM3-RCL]